MVSVPRLFRGTNTGGTQLEAIGRSGTDPLDPLEGKHTETSTTVAAQRQSWLQQQSLASRGGIIAAVIAVIAMAILFDKIRSTIVTVVIAVSVCAAIWIGANLLFDQARSRWQRFNTLWFATLGILLGVVLHGNGLTIGSEGGVWSWILGPARRWCRVRGHRLPARSERRPAAAPNHLDRRVRPHRGGDRPAHP